MLLHVCCADCILKFTKIIDENENLILYYYNPNIHPRSEYFERLNAIKKVIKDKKFKLVVPDYIPQEYFVAIKSKSNKISLNKCHKCWELRIEKTCQYAKDNNIGQFSTTLLTSKYQNRDEIISIANKLAMKYGIEFVSSKEICLNLRTAGFYKQNYCGCCYSLVKRYEEKHYSI